MPTTTIEPVHEPVMLAEVVRFLTARPQRAGWRVVDLTVGLGGHAEALLAALPGDAALLGIDRDPRALPIAARRLARFGSRARVVHARFSDLAAVLDGLGWERVDLVLGDLGVSSLQLDDPARGFSFRARAPLDMRMDPSAGPTAAELLRRSSEAELAELLRDLGEEPQARRIARALRAGGAAPPATTDELRAAVASAAGGRGRRHDPATLTFQALRIAVNHELEELEAVLEALPARLAPGARVGFLAYHSLEDRIVKDTFRSWTASCICPPGIPLCRCGGRPRARRLIRGALAPEPAEVVRNPRARSAHLRAVEWIDAG